MNCVYIFFRQNDANPGLTWHHADDKTADSLATLQMIHVLVT